jgi:nucleoside-diphosphate-sugar epimerase
MNEVISTIERVMGRRLDIRRQPAEKGDMRDTFADTARARDDLGFEPGWTLEAGLRRECEWLAVVLDRPRAKV